MHRHAFTPIEGSWFAQNLPCSEGTAPLGVTSREVSSSAHKVYCGQRASRFEHRDLLLVAAGEFVMRRANGRMLSGLLGRLLFREAVLIVSKVLFHSVTPGR
jgi:hypothetical protein